MGCHRKIALIEYTKGTLLDIYNMVLRDAGTRKHQPGSDKKQLQSKIQANTWLVSAVIHVHVQVSWVYAIFIIPNPQHFTQHFLFWLSIIRNSFLCCGKFSFLASVGETRFDESFPRFFAARHKYVTQVSFVKNNNLKQKLMTQRKRDKGAVAITGFQWKNHHRLCFAASRQGMTLCFQCCPYQPKVLQHDFAQDVGDLVSGCSCLFSESYFLVLHRVLLLVAKIVLVNFFSA